MKLSHPMLVPQVHVAIILQRNRCLSTESLTLDCLVNFASLTGLSIEPSRVYKYYSKLHDISKNLGSPLQPKKAKQVDGKLQSIKKVAKGFESLYKKQVELSWF